MKSPRYWQLRSRSQRLGKSLSTAQIAIAARAADLTALIRIGVRVLSKSALLILPPLLALIISQSAIRANGLLADWITNQSNWIEQSLTWLTSSAPNSIDTAALPTAAVGVAGVFVAVYFATVTFVVSTTYRDATKRLRNQIIRQPESRWYAYFFSQAVVFLTLILNLPIINQTPTHLTMVIGGVSVALVVLSFGRIWITLFVLLEPTSLFPQLQRDLKRWAHRAYKLGTRKSPSPVAVQRATVGIQSDLETLNDLVTLILDREYERVGNRGISASFDPRIGSAMMTLLSSWAIYSKGKHAIRTLPEWNPTRAQSKDWFLASHVEVSVALATGTTLSGNKVIDDLWFERRLADFAERLLAGRDLRSIADVLRAMPPLSRSLGSRGQFEELRLWITSTTFAAMTEVSAYAKERGEIKVESLTSLSHKPHFSREQHLALPNEASAHNLVDHVLLEALSACLGYIDYFDRMRQMIPSLGALVADGSKPLIAGKLPIESTVNLRKSLAMEIDTEGTRVTPDNALTQLVARALATEVIDEVENLIAFIEREIWPWVLEIGETRSWAAGAALSRATELTEKLETLVEFERQLLDGCESVHIEKDDRWPETDTEAISARATSLKDQLELPIAHLAATVDSAPDDDRPDHFGWAYYRAHENVLARVLSRKLGDPTELSQKVALLCWAGDVATLRLIATVRRHDQSVINSHVAEPHMRFLQLSGIALTISEVTHDRALFTPFESLWMSLFQDADQTTHLLRNTAAKIHSESALLGLTPRGIERTNFENRAHRALDELGVPRNLFDHDGFNYAEELKPSSLTDSAKRVLQSVKSSNYEGMFYQRWIRPHALAAGGEAPTDIEQHFRLFAPDEESKND